jgi:protein-S-isoprenylcysteine O-methyltransferase Ste14
VSLAARTALYGAVFLGLVVGYLPYAARSLDARLASAVSVALKLGGLGLFVGGAALAFASASYLVRRGEGTPALFDPPRRLVVAGPYQYVRHPMMVGVFAMIFGEALWFASAAIMLYGWLAVALGRLFVAHVEEPGLERRFGEDYLVYKQRVPRWLPARRSELTARGRRAEDVV